MRKKIIIGSVLVLSIAGLLILNLMKMNKTIPVTMVVADEGAIQESIFANGKLESMAEGVLFLPYSGTVEHVAVKQGERVKKGQSLLKMSDEDLEEQIRLEENNKEMTISEQSSYRKKMLDTAKKELIAGKPAEDLIDKDELNVYRLRLERSEMSIEALRNKLESRELIADMDGVVTEVSVKAGQTAAEGTSAFKIIDDRNLRVKAYLNELDAGKVVPNMEAAITGDAFEGSFNGKISYVAPVAEQVDPSSRDPFVEFWVDLSDVSEQIRPGYNATVEIVTSEEQHVLLPLTAVRMSADKAYVFEVQDGLAVQKEVHTGKDDGEKIEILEGVTVGTQVIADLTEDVADGKKVKLP